MEHAPSAPGRILATQVLERGAPGYPQRLLQLARPPEVLYVRGSTASLSEPQIAIVGARAASPAGCATAFEFAAALARAGLTVTSGLALGIDTAGHEGALADGGATVALCAHGLDRVYPPQNTPLAGRIERHGALASLHADGIGARRQHFPARNALISALSIAVVVVEAQPGSGSLITARQAQTQGRRVFAVPGSIRDPLSLGCNQLIRAGATAVTNPAELLSDLGLSESKYSNEIQIVASHGKTGRTAQAQASSLDKHLEMLLDAAGFEPVGIDFLADRTNLSAAAVVSMLLLLELQGRIAPQPGGRYRRLT